MSRLVIALEEHYWDEACCGPISLAASAGSREIALRLCDVGPARIAAMDEAGVDIQVLSHSGPSAQAFGIEDAKEKAMRMNDRLAAINAHYPSRLKGFAALPTIDPDAAAEELTRCVRSLGFLGGIIFGLTNAQFIDEARFDPVFAAAHELNVPLYIHPAMPHKQVASAYYSAYEDRFPMLMRAAWGFTVEAATQAVRLVISDIFDKYPRLRIILGHLGEGVPFLSWRIHNTISGAGAKFVDFQSRFKEHFFITTSGFFSTPALRCAIDEMGHDRIMFAVDYPFMDSRLATTWMKNVALDEDVRTQILGGNAMRLFPFDFDASDRR